MNWSFFAATGIPLAKSRAKDGAYRAPDGLDWQSMFTHMINPKPRSPEVPITCAGMRPRNFVVLIAALSVMMHVLIRIF